MEIKQLDCKIKKIFKLIVKTNLNNESMRIDVD